MALAYPLDLDRKQTYYLSGPMSGYPEHNFPMFETAYRLCLIAGIEVLSPHRIKHPEGTSEFSDYLKNDLKQMLNHCHGIFLLPGWPQSRGARFELDVAMRLDWPAYYFNLTLQHLHSMNRDGY